MASEQPIQTYTSEPGTNLQMLKLFVGQVPSGTTEDVIRQIFGQYGTITEITILKDRLTGNHKGCAFVTFTDQKDAETAIEGTNDKIKLPMANRELIVRFAGTAEKKASSAAGGGTAADPIDHKLYVGMLSRKSTEEEIKKIFEPYGEVLEIHLMKHKDTGLSKGSAFIKYATRDEALRAIRALNEAYKDKDASGPLQVRFAQTKQEKNMKFGVTQQLGGFGAGLALASPSLWANSPFGGGFGGAVVGGGLAQGLGGLTGMGNGLAQIPTWNLPQAPVSSAGGKEARGPQGANLFVYNIPDTYGDTELALLFSNFGSIISATVQVDKQTGKKKGFGFVSYHDPTAALAAISSMDGFMLEGRRLNVRHKTAKGVPGVGSKSGFSPY